MTNPPVPIQQVTAHAMQLGDRINTAGFEGQVLSNTPLALRIGPSGIAVVFRYGVAVFIGLTTDQEQEFLERLKSRTDEEITQPAPDLLGRSVRPAGSSFREGQRCAVGTATAAERLLAEVPRRALRTGHQVPAAWQ